MQPSGCPQSAAAEAVAANAERLTMCSKLFGKDTAAVFGDVGEVGGALVGGYFGGPIGAAAGAEAGGTLGKTVAGVPLGQAAESSLTGAAVAGVGAEVLGPDVLNVAPTGGVAAEYTSDFGSAAAPSAVSAVGTDPSIGSVDPTGGFNGPADPNSVMTTQSAATSPDTGLVGSTGPSDTGWTATGGGPQAPQPIGAWPNATGPSTGNTTAGGWTDATPSGGGSMLSNIANTLGISKSSIIPAGVAGIGLAKDLLSPTNSLQGQSQLSAEAAQTASQSQTMQNYLTTGTLPPGVQTTINNATSGAQAAIRAKYASMGLSGSSMETQELNQLNLNAASAGAQVALNLYTQGLSDAQISAGIYKTLLSTDQEQQQLTSNAISNMAAALSGGTQIRTQQPQQQPVAT